MKLPRENVYRCEFGCLTTTVDVDEGVTPFFIKCRSKPTAKRPIDKKYLGEDGECIGLAKSSFYPKEPRPPFIPEPKFEWYRPSDLSKLTEAELEHVRQGGLLMRSRTDAVPMFHAEILERGKE